VRKADEALFLTKETGKTKSVSMENKRLGESLLNQGLINKEDLNQALKEQKINGKLLGSILIEKGLITNKKLSEILELQKEIKTVSLSRLKISPSVVKLIPESLARRFLSLAISREKNLLKVVMANPKDIVAIDILRKNTGCEIEVLRGSKKEIEEAIEKYYGEFGDVEEALSLLTEESKKRTISELKNVAEDTFFELKNAAEDSFVIKYVQLFLASAVEKDASDIHLEPREKEISLRFRIDGVLQKATPPSLSVYPGVVSRIKILSNLDIAERRLPQDGRFKFKVGKRKVDLRVSTFPTVFGEKVVIRILDRSKLVLEPERLGMEREELAKFRKVLKRPYGMVLVTGPTGSGKTTTLYSALNYLNDPRKNIVTVEDPVEYQLEGINQTPARPEIGLSFAQFLRHILRQDPDIIMVGEIRDLETANIAIRSALTGHLVLSTLHTNDSVSAINRLINMGVEPYLISSCLNLVIAQRLIRLLCPECKEKTSAPPGLLGKCREIYQAKGCSFCGATGYKGRIGIYELFEISSAIEDMILKRVPEKDLREEVKKEGMKTLRENGLDKVCAGITSLEEVLSITEERG